MMRSLTKLLILLAVVHLLSACALREDRQSESQRLAEFLEAVYQRRLAADPMLATRLGLKDGNDRWTDLSIERMNADERQHWLDLNTLHTSFDIEKLDSAGQFNYRAFEAELKLRIERASWRYHLNPINQIVGLHLQIPGLLINYHLIDSSDDAQAYIARLRSAGQPIDQFIAFFKARESRGFSLPKSVLPRLIDAAQKVVQGDLQAEVGGGVEGRVEGSVEGEGEQNVLMVDFTRKVNALAIGESDKAGLIGAARSAIEDAFIPAYQRLIAAFEQHRPLADSDQGVWRLADGEQFYRFLLQQYTTTAITAEEVHQLGLAEVERIHAEMNEIKAEVGFAGSLEAFFAHLKSAPGFYYANTAEGRRDYLQFARGIVDNAAARVGDILPQAPGGSVVVKRIEPYREKSAPVGFYESGTADGVKPGTVYLGMYDMSGLSTVDLPALLFHEGIPGHHLQSVVMQTQEHIPNIRKYYIWWSNTAYTEGWALYAEYLASELGLYHSPYAEFGRLAGELWRACRLVVDSGLHARRWSRQQAIDYLTQNTASSVANNQRAVDRYLAVPGQATAFKIGMMKILQLRERARAELKDKFDIREFHYRVLRNGPVPLDMLEREVLAWIDANTDANQDGK